MVHMSHIHLCGGWLLKLKMKEDGSVPKRCSEVKMKRFSEVKWEDGSTRRP